MVLKEKFNTLFKGFYFLGKAKKLALLAIIFVISVGAFFSANNASALVTYDASQDIAIGLNTLTKGPGGKFVPDNLIRASKTDTAAEIQYELRITNPYKGLVFGTDQVAAGSVGALTIRGVGAGADAVDPSGGGTSCVSASTSSGGKTFNYTTCALKDSNDNRNGTFSSSTPISGKPLVIHFSKYGLDANNTTDPQQIIVYPFLAIDGAKPMLIFANVGIRMYVQFYPTQAAADAATASGARPAVPGYGGATTPATSGGSLTDLANTNALAGFLTKIVTLIVGFFSELIYGVFSFLVAPLIQAMLSIHTYTDTFVGVIYPGWEIVRNICNIIFIIALIVIALATLFRVESYQFRHLLVQLIIAALLINFSLVIGQAILGLADTVQAQFLPANVTVIRSLAGDLMVKNWRTAFFDVSIFSGQFSDIVKPIFFLTLSAGSFMVFCAIAVFLVIRIVALWLLLLISPIAYACGVLPSTAGYRSQWWQHFLKYAFFTPIMAFFLNLTAVISTTFSKNPVLEAINDPAMYKDLGGSGLADFVVRVSSNILLLVFLLAALKVADSAGVIGASAVTGIAKKGMFLPLNVTKDVVGGWAQKRYNNKTAKLAEGGNVKKAIYAGLHLPSTIKSFRKDSSEELQRSKDLTSAATLSIKRQVPGFRRRGEDPLALYNEHKGKELLEERRGESTDTEEDEVVFGLQLVDEASKGDQDAILMIPEQLRRMVKNHNINDFTEKFGQKYMGLGKGELKYKKENLIGMLGEIQKMGGMSEHVNTDLQKRLGKLGYEMGDHTASEMTYNDEHGHAQTIKTEFDKAKKSFVVVGQDVYDRIHNDAQTHATSQADYQARIDSGVAALSSSDKSNYANAQKNSEKIMENRVNLKKKQDLPQLQQWWESMVSYESDGKTPVLGISGGHVFTHLGTGHEFLATRGSPSTKILEIYLPLVKDPVKLKQEIKKALTEDAFAKNIRIENIDVAVKKEEYQNLRVAALAEKDTDLKGMEKFDLNIPGTPPGTSNPMASTDPRYEALLDVKIRDLRGILKK